MCFDCAEAGGDFKAELEVFKTKPVWLTQGTAEANWDSKQ